MRDAVESSWVRYARVNFVNWDTCGTLPQDNDHVRINIGDVQPQAFPIGTDIIGVPAGVKLNFSFVAWTPSGPGTIGATWCNQNDANREHCVRSIAIHEFGHVLGFYHEEERPDYVPSLADPCDSGPNFNGQSYGAYDRDSIMSFCGQPNDQPALWKTELSAGDIAGVQSAYGRRVSGSVVSARGDCLSNQPDAFNGDVSFIWDCDEADGQEWYFSGDNLFLASSPNRCLENEWWSNQSGDDVFVWTCGGYSTQEWSFERVAVRGWGGLCLDLQNGNTANGTNVQMWECQDGNANQEWTISDIGEVKFGGPNSNACLTAFWGQVFIWECAFPDYQRFTFTANGEIRPTFDPAVCLDVQGWTQEQYENGNGLPQSGLNVQTFNCIDEQMNQKWNFSGEITHDETGLCLDRRWNGSNNGTVVQLWGCNDTAAQEWDYYFR
ncbi:MAG: ricin-type beta-trefoil lectin domain protein [Myxococcales bacterium]|nr:ricin-type beta-trefoil lectin domain protein [Myxococcales bacterium]